MTRREVLPVHPANAKLTNPECWIKGCERPIRWRIGEISEEFLLVCDKHNPRFEVLEEP